MEVSLKIVAETWRKNINDLYAVKLRVTYNRKPKYYSIKSYLNDNEWNYCKGADDLKEIMAATRQPKKDIRFNYEAIYERAKSIINNMNIFSFDKFETEFLNKTGNWDFLANAFEEHIKYLTGTNRLGYVSTFKSTLTTIKYFMEKKSFIKGVQPEEHAHFKKYKDLKFSDITPMWLEKYETFMRENGRSTSTCGIHTRNIRTVFNIAIKDHKIKVEYPFHKYKPKTAENNKRALTAEQISAIINYKVPNGTRKELYLDLFTFSFLANGMNIGDILNLKYSNIKGDEIEFVREKTKGKSKEVKITISYTDTLKNIIHKHGNKAINNKLYIFPIFNLDMNENTKRNTKKQFTKRMNNFLKYVAKEIGMEKEIANNISTYYARHSFATILKNSGTSQEYLKEALGHENLATTEKYLSSFEKEEKKKQANKLENIINQVKGIA